MRSKVAEDWIEQSARTATARDHAAHMDLVSRRVQVYGVHGFEVIGYDDWFQQSAREFAQGVMKRVTYEGCEVREMVPGRVLFNTVETVETNDGTASVSPLEVLIEKEADGKWRVVRERIVSREECGVEP